MEDTIIVIAANKTQIIGDGNDTIIIATNRAGVLAP
jgi:hypothetical protein